MAPERGDAALRGHARADQRDSVSRLCHKGYRPVVRFGNVLGKIHAESGHGPMLVGRGGGFNRTVDHVEQSGVG